MLQGKTDMSGRQTAAPVYEVVSLSKKREKGGVTFELLIRDLVIRQGEFIAIVGPSGCGKSTLLDLFGLVMRPGVNDTFLLSIQKGEFADRWNVPDMDERQLAGIRKKHIGYVLQNGGLLPYLTVAENICLTARLNNMPDMKHNLQELAEYLGISSQLRKKPQELSGGQRQRAAIARALIHRPAIVLADEPTAAVDKPTAMEIRDQFSMLAAKFGVSVLMVTHDESLVRPVVDRMIGFEVEKRTAEHTVSRVVHLPI